MFLTLVVLILANAKYALFIFANFSNTQGFFLMNGGQTILYLMLIVDNTIWNLWLLMGYINAGVIVLKSPFYGPFFFENTYEQEPKLYNQSTVRQLSGIHSKLTRSINLNDNNTTLDM